MPRLASFAIAVAIATACLLPPPAARAEPLERVAGSRLMVQAKIAGHPVRALLDSAAEMTLVDAALARQLGLRPAQQASGSGSGQSSFEAGLVPGVAIDALGLQLRDQVVAVTDLGDVGRRLLGQPLEVILGREVFDAARLEIDVAAGTIRVLPAREAPRGMRLALRAEHGVETIPVSIEGHAPVRATFDLGNGAEVLVSRRYARRLGLLHDGRAVGESAGGGLGGEAKRESFRLRTLVLAGQELRDVPAAIDPQESASDLNVGVAVLGRFRIVTDFASRAVWLEPRGGSGLE